MKTIILTCTLLGLMLSHAPAGEIDAGDVIADVRPVGQAGGCEISDELSDALADEVEQLIEGHPWAPMYVSIGIGGRALTFDHTSYLVESLAWAIPHLPDDLARRAQQLARSQLAGCLTPRGLAPLEGTRRELYQAPEGDIRSTSGGDWPAICHVNALWQYGHRTGDWQAVEELWPQVRAAWQAYQRQPIQISPDAGHHWMGRTTAGVLAYARLAERFGSDADVRVATDELQRLLDQTLAYARAMGTRAGGILDEVEVGGMYGRQGQLLYEEQRSHQARIVIFMDLAPAVADAIASAEPEAVDNLRQYVRVYQPTYYLAFEERQVHYGESFIELPDSVRGLFRADAWLFDVEPAELAARADVAWCKADLFYIEKLSIALEAMGGEHAPPE